MELAALQQSIIKGEKKPYYVFCGLETSIRDVYINEIAKKFSLTKTSIEEPGQALTAQDNNLLSVSSLYVIKENKDLLTDENLIAKLKSYKGKNSIVFCYTEIDKRKATYKALEEDVVWFNHLTEDKLVPYIKKLVPNASEDFCRDLTYVAENNYGRLLLELDKATTYAKIEQLTIEKAFYDLLASGVITPPETADTIAFVNSFMSGDAEKTFMLADLIDSSQFIGALSLLYSNIRQYYLVYSYSGSGKITEETGLQYFIIQKIKDSKKYFDIETLEFGMGFILKVISEIKNGTIEVETALYYVIAKLL
jgi:DNA polymerase III delta subunit